MFFEANPSTRAEDATRLSLEDLIAIQPHHVRGRLAPGRRGPDGERPGLGRSTTLDFDGLSPYVPGDDVRAIDWRATMRSGQTTMRRFAAGSHRAHMVVVDLRPDLFFGTADRIMAKTACLAAAWFAWKAQTLHEPIGLTIGSQTIAPRRGRRHVLHLLDTLVKRFADGGKHGRQTPDCEAAAALVGRRDEVCLISDPPSDPGPLEALGRSLSRSRILRLVLVEDPFTTRPAAAGRYPVQSADRRREIIRIAEARPPGANVEGRLMDAGWTIQRAADLLPRRRTP